MAQVDYFVQIGTPVFLFSPGHIPLPDTTEAESWLFYLVSKRYLAILSKSSCRSKPRLDTSVDKFLPSINSLLGSALRTEVHKVSKQRLQVNNETPLPLMFLQPTICTRAYRPLSRLSRQRSPVMPLKAKITNYTFVSQAQVELRSP